MSSPASEISKNFTDVTAASSGDRSPAEAVFASPAPTHSDHLWESSYYEHSLSPDSMKVEYEVAKCHIIQSGILHRPVYLANPCREMRRCIVFLFGRGFYGSSEKEEIRIERIESMIKDGDVRKRLVRIMTLSGDEELEENEIFLEQYKIFVTTLWRFFEYGCKSSRPGHSFRRFWNCFPNCLGGAQRPVGFLNDMTLAIFYMRLQEGATCYLHAPCAFVGYQMQRDYPGQTFGTINVARYARYNMSKTALLKSVTTNGGGYSTEELRTLLQMRKQSDVREIFAPAYRSELVDLLLKDGLRGDGTGLVSCFKVSEDFFCEIEVSAQDSRHLLL